MKVRVNVGAVLSALARYHTLMQQNPESEHALDEEEVEYSKLNKTLATGQPTNLLKAADKHTSLVQEYSRLSCLSTLSDEDVDRMDAILEQAESDSVLSFLISEADYLIGQQMGFFVEGDTSVFANEQAWLREHLETSRDFSPRYAQEFQQRLQEMGFYDGAVDGVLGEKTAIALVKFQREYNLVVDGLPGVQTFIALETGKDYYRELQRLLKKQGFYTGEIDGIWGVESRTALFKFQISNENVKADGFPGPNTYMALRAHSGYLKKVQTLLKERGFYEGEIDGVVSKETRLAVQKFQASNNLNVDGIPGKATYDVLRHSVKRG